MTPSTDKARSKPPAEPVPLLQRLADLPGRCYHGAVPFLGGAFLALVVTAALWPALQTPERYTEPVVGTDTMLGFSKTADLHAYYLALGLAVVLLLAIGRLLRRLSGPGDDDERRQAVNGLALLGLLPALAWLAGSLVAPTGFTIPWFAAAFFVGALVLVYGLSRHAAELSPEAIRDLGATGLLILFFSFLAGLAFSTALSRSASAVSALGPLLTVIPWIAAGLGLALILALLWQPAARTDLLSRRLHDVLLLVQAPLPLLVLALIPPPVFDTDGSSFSEGSSQLTLLVIIAAAVLEAFWFRQWRRRTRPLGAGRPPTSCAAFLCPCAIGAVVVFLALGPFGLPTVPTDDFHFGEMMLPWHQWRHFGAVPFVDLNPERGFTYMIFGAMNDGLYNGGMTGFNAAAGALAALLLPLGFALTWRLAGPAAGLAAALGCGILPANYCLLWPARTSSSWSGSSGSSSPPEPSGPTGPAGG